MPYEPAQRLLSGPDVGGGFLLQLSEERPPLPAGYTYHLQEGGTDAAAAPAASLEPLGFAHPPAACMFGGPRCWERSFAAPGESASAVRNSYNRFRFILGPLLEQRAGRRPVPMEQGLTELLDRLLEPLRLTSVPWEIGGSTGAWIRGVPIAPKHIDVGTTADGARVIGQLLEDARTEPVHERVEPDGRRQLWGSAFLGTLVEGVRVEWGGATRDVEEGAAEGEWHGRGLWTRVERVEWHGRRVPLAPLEFELVRLLERGRNPEAEAVLKAAEGSLHVSTLKTALDGSRLSPAQRAELGKRLLPALHAGGKLPS
ncbi:MAG: hypothetical protein L3K07_02285 [Thermoplasmata archaeon]|nr:hypothetical protein [Thermoplasmata archaeon]